MKARQNLNSQKNILFSLIVPVYNTEQYLSRCVDSILGQTYKNFELILVDDGSLDGSPKMCDEYAKKDSRMRVIHQKNGRQTKARNAGLSISKGEYILLVDSDDWIELNLLEVVLDEILKSGSDIVTFDSYFSRGDRRVAMHQAVPSGVFDKQGLINNIYPKMISSGRFFYFGIYAAMWNKVFRRSILIPNITNVDNNIRIGEDGLTTFAAFLDAQKISILSGQYLYNYREDNFSITRSYYPEQFINAKLLIESLREVNKLKAVYDLSSQIDEYFMYNIYAIFIEEFYYKHKKSLYERIKYLTSVANDRLVVSTVNSVSFDNMNNNFKLFFSLLKSGKIGFLISLVILLAIKKRLKLEVRRLLGKDY